MGDPVALRASQGAGKLLWPVIGNIARLAVALGGGWLAIHHFNSLTGVFVAQAVALVTYGGLNALGDCRRRLIRAGWLATNCKPIAASAIAQFFKAPAGFALWPHARC